MKTPIGKLLKRRAMKRAQWQQVWRTFRLRDASSATHAELDRILYRHSPLMLDADVLSLRAAWRARFTAFGAQRAMPEMIKKSHGRAWQQSIPGRIPALHLDGHRLRPRVVHLPGAA